jgi:cytochrome c-type biogenesis protein CcmH/NrfG
LEKRRLGKREGSWEAGSWYDLGCVLLGARRYEEALRALKEAEVIEGGYAGLKGAKMRAHFCLGEWREAYELARDVVGEEPKDIRAWGVYSNSARALGKWEEALRGARRGYELSWRNAGVLHTLGVIEGERGRWKLERELLERAVKVEPGDTYARYALGKLQLREGEYEEGWKNFEVRWEHGWNAAPYYGVMKRSPVRFWEGEGFGRAVVVVIPEQGIGDSIVFVRYVRRLAERARGEGGLIVLICYDNLERLFVLSLADDGDVVNVRGQGRGMCLQPGDFMERPRVLKTGLGSLPLRFGEVCAPEGIAYLRADVVKVERWRERLGEREGFKIGLCWTGRRDHFRNDLRSVRVEELVGALEDIEGVSLYSLQFGEGEQARAAGLLDWTGELADFDDTAALVSALDLVISIDGVIAHLGGALGMPTWVLVDVNPHYTWGRTGSTTPWYGSVRVYRQGKMLDWRNVYEAVRQDLSEVVGTQ